MLTFVLTIFHGHMRYILLRLTVASADPKAERNAAFVGRLEQEVGAPAAVRGHRDLDVDSRHFGTRSSMFGRGLFDRGRHLWILVDEFP